MFAIFLQKKSHFATLPKAADILLLDATSNLDRSETKLFHMMTPAAVGALPLGTIITTREDEKTLREDFK